jgi:hypothetical protein
LTAPSASSIVTSFSTPPARMLPAWLARATRWQQSLPAVPTYDRRLERGMSAAFPTPASSASTLADDAGIPLFQLALAFVADHPAQRSPTTNTSRPHPND